MKNNRPSDLFTAKDLFHTIGEAMRNGEKHRNADNYASMKSRVDVQLDLYDAALDYPISLENLRPLWSKQCDEKETARNLYESQPELIQKIRNDLMRINGKGHEYKCPLCEVNNVKHLDHYIPREKMPEFSVHPRNLIYICSECNENKGTSWLDEHGLRKILNVYYDQLTDKDIFVCKVDSRVNDMPWAELIVNPNIHDDEAALRVLRTLQTLKIDDLYKEKVNDLLQSKCLEALDQVIIMKTNEGKNIDQAWDFLLCCYQRTLERNKNIVDRMVLQGMCSSSIIKPWLDSISNKELGLQ